MSIETSLEMRESKIESLGILAVNMLVKMNTLNVTHNKSRRRRYVCRATRNAIVLSILIPAFATGGGATETDSVSDFYITVTANDLYLCGEGFGGLYGCIDEAVSRESKSVVISASSEASVLAVQELLNAVHAVGFDQVGLATFDEAAAM